MNPPTAGLRPLWNNSKQPAKVSVIVAPGDALVVSDDLAGQLQAYSTHFEDGTPTWTPDQLGDKAEPVAEPESTPAPEPVKRPAKKAAAKTAD